MNRRAFFAFAGMVLVPFGPLSDRLHERNPWRGDDNAGAVLLLVRAQDVAGADCKRWSRALARDPRGVEIARGAVPDPEHWKEAWKQWEAVKDPGDLEEEKKDARKCTGFPCGVKLNREQVQALSATPEPARYDKFLSLVQFRVEDYLKTGVRREYEFAAEQPGVPAGTQVDPWLAFEKAGLRSELKMPAASSLWARRVDLAPGKLKPTHQILDYRTAIAPDGLSATAWLRDAYTDHYYDSWGEWGNVSCLGSGKDVRVVLSLFVDLDMLKKHDILSLISRGKMKDAVRTLGQNFLDEWYGRLSQSAEFK